MRSLVTHHVECIRRGLNRRVLDVEYLLELLQYTDAASRNAPRAVNGKKRAAQEDIAPPRRRVKRFKKATDATDDIEKDADDDGDAEETPSTVIPVYRHTLELRYTRSVDDLEVVDEEEVHSLGWVERESALRDWLATRVQASDVSAEEPWSAEIPSVKLRAESKRLLVYGDDGSSSFLLQLPQLDPEFNLEEHDMRHHHIQDPLVACAVLQEAGLVEMSASLRAHAENVADDAALPLRLTLCVTVSFLMPEMSKSILYTTKIATSEVEEARRRALWYIFPPTMQNGSRIPHVDVPTLYSSIGPAPSLDSPSMEANYQPVTLLPTLLPFQRRTVAWLLSREHKELDPNGDVVDKPATSKNLPIFWQAFTLTSPEGEKQEWHVNHVTGDISLAKPDESGSLGGILAEEPGLGKTLESIALVLLNPALDRNPTQKTWNSDAKIYVKAVKTTLIVTPNSLAQQWADELKLHAPGLKVLVYDGHAKVKVPITEKDLAIALEEKAKAAKKAKARADRAVLAAAKSQKAGAPSRKSKRKAVAIDIDAEAVEDVAEPEPEPELLDWCNYVNTFDVCITTYNVLQQDLGIARPPPDRPRRTIATYINVERSRSPLIMCEWYRVIMDEVQMVGGGKTEEMVSLIPRLSSFAVSGTPARSHIADLIHVLNFLRVDSVTPRIWSRLLKPGYADQLVQLFLRYAVRTMKASVRDELTIPKQTRYLVPIELGRVERHVYDQNLEKALLELGFDARGVAIAENWQVDTGNLRTWLRKLRGICTHPQVGQLQNKADKLNKPGVLKTMAEVLENMKEQNWRNFMEDRRSRAQLLTIIAQLYQHHEEHHHRYRLALENLLKAEKETDDLIKDVELALQAHDEEGRSLRDQASAMVGDLQPEPGTAARANKGKGRAETVASEDDDGLPKNAAGEEHRIKKRAIQQRLRECQITLHKVHFLKGDVYHILERPAEEAAAYEKAEDLRRVLLRSTEEAANRAMLQLAHEMGGKRLTEEELLIEVPYLGAGAIKSHLLMEEANEIIAEVLNPQSAQLWKWRNHLVKLLTQPLTSKDGEADGQEYARSLETQGEAEAYLQAYAALLADRREVMTAERTLLAAHDVKEKKKRGTKAALKAELAMLDEDVIMAVGDIDPQPEDEVLRKELNDQRKALLEEHDPERAVRSVMVELTNISAGIHNEKDPEKIIAGDAAKSLRELIAQQAQLMERLQADLARLRRAFNERIQYFRQLQELSDTVADAEWEGSVEAAIQQNVAESAELEVKINTGRARQRYLEHLAKSQGEGALDEDEESCILCKCEFERGFITQCAHMFCEECMKAWLLRKEGTACPVCRVPINVDQLQRFALGKGQAQDAPARPVNNEPAPKSRRHIEYNFIDPGVFESIQTMEAHGSYGSKIQTLVRHLLYIQISEPGAKSIVFSAWADSLYIIEHALRRNAIPCLRIDQSTGRENAAKKFRTNPDIQVLLLHGERENAGLNITCASRVFLLESVVHHAFEIQAIARIDRMGQTRPTEVFCYYAEDTVERNILDLAARRGQSLYTKDHAAGTLTAGPITAPEKGSIDAPKKSKKAQKGDFVFKTDDMLAILFPHLFEDVEYLIPLEESNSQESSSSSRIERSQPVAGPSRLR